jgi:Protein of unknown function (DUF1592)/Protein of unknown function (DUF1588)/Protein of unknown function (DUF1587)/Protein of unknown function (DUF1595)/Protein of unknown function (DUF1585)
MHTPPVVQVCHAIRIGLTVLFTMTAYGCYTGVSDFEHEPFFDPGHDHDDATDDDEGETSGDTGEPGELDPGRVTMHRLTNAEYDNTIRDLFYGLDVHPAAEFPADEVSLGFDNIADVQSVTPVLFELYDRAAEQTIALALASSVRDQILTCQPAPGAEAACADEILRAFGKRAWRRPLADPEVERLVALVQEAVVAGNDFSQGIALGLQTLLVSPHFVFRVELDPNPHSLVPHALTDHELAARLSYFVWSTMPDDELTTRADAGTLNDPDVLAAQVRRMLQDERAEALVDDFAGQWLYLRNLGYDLAKDYTTFPEFDAELQASMRTEAEMFFRTFIHEGRSLQELLTAEDTFVDARLAEHYGLPAPQGQGFQRVSLAGLPRRGLLTQPGLLSVLSHAAVTSPVKRGKWVLEQLMCIHPPPPPPGVEVPPLPPGEGGTMRDQLEQHRADPTCAACHQLMDPIGLGLEHYDAIGRYRELDSGQPIDASGTLPTGETFDDALGMVGLLASGDGFAACTARKTLTYALGRETVVSDEPYLDEIEADFQAADMTLEGLLVAVVTNDTFRTRRGEELGS